MFYLNLTGLLFNFLGSLILGYSLLHSKEDINKISGTYYGGNNDLKNSLLRDRKLAICGLTILSTGFFLQLLAILI